VINPLPPRCAFNGVHALLDPARTRYAAYRGSCECGAWWTSTNKDLVWHYLGEHIIPTLIRELNDAQHRRRPHLR